jgi:type III secretory pathway component EscR
MIESKLLPERFKLAEGLLTTMMNSYSALGPSFNVMRFVNSFEIGFSIYQDSCLISLLTIVSPFLLLLAASPSKEKGRLLSWFR